MSMTEMTVSFPTEKLEALRFFMDKKQQTIEQELKDHLDMTYEKMVPAKVREFVESRMGQAPDLQQPEAGQAPVTGGRPVRQTRRQREQAEAEASSLLEMEAPAEEENQSMTMSL